MIQIFDVWAEWCAPCKRFSPIFESVSREFPEAEFIKVNADENSGLLIEYDIHSIPTILVVDSGTVVHRHIGILGYDAFRELVGSYYYDKN